MSDPSNDPWPPRSWYGRVLRPLFSPPRGRFPQPPAQGRVDLEEWTVDRCEGRWANRWRPRPLPSLGDGRVST